MVFAYASITIFLIIPKLDKLYDHQEEKIPIDFGENATEFKVRNKSRFYRSSE